MKANTSEQMTDEEINIAIAEACGWRQSLAGWWHHPDSRCEAYPPDYTADLDAIHEAIMAQSGGTQCVFADNLDQVVNRGLPKSFNSLVGKSALVNASARQRAEAFLRTIGQWRE